MQIEEFKNRHQGNRAWIVGNDTTVDGELLNKLSGEFTFAVNRISMIYPHTEWRPTFYSCVTTNVIKRNHWAKDANKSIDLGVPSFVGQPIAKHLKKSDNVVLINPRHGQHITDSPKLEWWSTDPSEYVCKFGTSILVPAQLAVYMGFSEIIFVGCSQGFKEWKEGKDPNHFDKSYGTPGLPPEQLNKNMKAAHRLIKNASEKFGFRVLDCSNRIGEVLTGCYEHRTVDQVLGL